MEFLLSHITTGFLVTILLQELPDPTLVAPIVQNGTTWWQYILQILAVALVSAIGQALRQKLTVKSEAEKLDDAIAILEKSERLKNLVEKKKNSESDES